MSAPYVLWTTWKNRDNVSIRTKKKKSPFSDSFDSMITRYICLAFNAVFLFASEYSKSISTASSQPPKWCLLTYILIIHVIYSNASGWQMLSHVNVSPRSIRLDFWKLPRALHEGVDAASLASTRLYSTWHTRAEMMRRVPPQRPVSQAVPSSHGLPRQHPRSSCWIMQSRGCSFSPALSLCARSSTERTAMPSTC